MNAFLLLLYSFLALFCFLADFFADFGSSRLDLGVRPLAAAGLTGVVTAATALEAGLAAGLAAASFGSASASFNSVLEMFLTAGLGLASRRDSKTGTNAGAASSCQFYNCAHNHTQ